MLQIARKLEKWQSRYNFLTKHPRHSFWRCFVSLVSFSYWSKFRVNVITSSRVMIISFYKGLTRNLERFEFCSISGDWERQGIPNLAPAFLIKCYRILRNARVTAFIIFEALRENKLEKGLNLPSPYPHHDTTQIRVN